MMKQSLHGTGMDYTTGSIRGAVVCLAVPMILELSLESVFALVDMFFVGQLGPNAIATVGLTESFIIIVYAIAIGLSTAATTLVARRIGEKNREAAAQAGAQSLIIALIVTGLLSLGGVIFAADILGMMGASDEVVREGTLFTRIMLGGSINVMVLFLINGIFRGAGDAAIAMKSLWLASLINIILCPIFIHSMGLPGAAIATVMGRGIGVLYQCYYLGNGKCLIHIRPSHFHVNKAMMQAILRLAWPATLQCVIASCSWIALTRLVAETGGTTASAGYQIAVRNLAFFILPARGLSNAAATLVGQNLGTKKTGRAEHSVYLTAQYNALFMGLVMVLLLFFSRPMICLFSQDDAVIAYGVKSMQILGSGSIFYSIGMVMTQALNGAGDTRTPTVINFIGLWLFQIPLAYFLAQGLDWRATGVCVAIPVAETMIAWVTWRCFRRGKWKQVAV